SAPRPHLAHLSRPCNGGTGNSGKAFPRVAPLRRRTCQLWRFPATAGCIPKTGVHPMSLPEKAFPVSWDQFHRDARALAWRLAGINGSWKAMVCITRGGLVPAAIVARELGIRVIETVCIASYHDYTEQGELQVLKEVAPDLLEND